MTQLAKITITVSDIGDSKLMSQIDVDGDDNLTTAIVADVLSTLANHTLAHWDRCKCRQCFLGRELLEAVNDMMPTKEVKRH